MGKMPRKFTETTRYCQYSSSIRTAVGVVSSHRQIVIETWMVYNNAFNTLIDTKWYRVLED